MTEAPTNSEGRPICGVPCYYGGTSAARKYASGVLGWMGHCNRVVKVRGAKCWRHERN